MLHFLLQKSYFHFSQTLTTLSLGGNDIGDEGVQHLAEALQKNEVMSNFRYILLFPIISPSNLIDTHQT